MTAEHENGSAHGQGASRQDDVAELYAMLAPRIAREVESQVARAVQGMVGSQPAAAPFSSAPLADSVLLAYAQLMRPMLEAMRVFGEMARSRGAPFPSDENAFADPSPGAHVPDLARMMEMLSRPKGWDASAWLDGSVPGGDQHGASERDGAPRDGAQREDVRREDVRREEALREGDLRDGALLQRVYGDAWRSACESWRRMAQTLCESFERHARAVAELARDGAPLPEQQRAAMDHARGALREIGEAMARESRWLETELTTLAASLDASAADQPVDEPPRRYSKTKR